MGQLLMIISILILIIIFIITSIKIKSGYGILCFVLSGIGMSFSILGDSSIQEKETAIECLKGNNPYEMKIQYEYKDSTYIPVDTLYIKKSK